MGQASAPTYWRFEITLSRTTLGKHPPDESSALEETSTWHRTALTRENHLCTLGGIRIRNLSKRLAADPGRRPRSHWDRPHTKHSSLKAHYRNTSGPRSTGYTWWSSGLRQSLLWLVVTNVLRDNIDCIFRLKFHASSSRTSRPLKIRAKRCIEKSVTEYRRTQSRIPEETNRQHFYFQNRSKMFFRNSTIRQNTTRKHKADDI